MSLRPRGVPPDTRGDRARWMDNLEPEDLIVEAADPSKTARGEAVTRRPGAARRGRNPDAALAETTIPCVGMVP